MSDVVYHDTEALESPDTEQRHIARFTEHDLVYGFKTFGTYDGVARFACDLLLGSRGEIAFAYWPHFDAGQDVFGSQLNSDPESTNTWTGWLTLLSSFVFRTTALTLNMLMPERLPRVCIVRQAEREEFNVKSYEEV